MPFMSHSQNFRPVYLYPPCLQVGTFSSGKRPLPCSFSDAAEQLQESQNINSATGNGAAQESELYKESSPGLDKKWPSNREGAQTSVCLLLLLCCFSSHSILAKRATQGRKLFLGLGFVWAFVLQLVGEQVTWAFLFFKGNSVPIWKDVEFCAT